MREQELSTRDLAETASTESAAASNETSDHDGLAERAGADESLARDPVAVEGGHEALLPDDQTERFTSRWQEIQTSFVDEPRNAVAEADALVADLMQRLAASFSQERERLENQWDRGDDVSTEDLRVALTRYRSFFERLLAA